MRLQITTIICRIGKEGSDEGKRVVIWNETVQRLASKELLPLVDL